MRKAFKPLFTRHLTHSEIPFCVKRMDWRIPQGKEKKLECMFLSTLTSPLEHTCKTKFVTCKIKLIFKKSFANKVGGQNVVAQSRKIFTDQDVQIWNIVFAKYKLS